jgi:hypothetical protein
MPVTYEGRVRWGGPTEANFWPAGDSDYTFNVERDDQALYSTAGYHVHIEFDSRETVDQWNNTDTWWKKFHQENGIDKADSERSGLIDGHYAVVIGMLGMDTYTGPAHAASSHGKTELHPVYAMFVRVDQNEILKQTSWAFFVRNWGNEGYCGPDDVKLKRQVVKVQIPLAAKVVSRNAWKGARNGDRTEVESLMNLTEQSNPAGMLLTFTLLRPEKQSWIVGDISFQEPQTVPVNEPKAKLPAQFEAVRAQIDKLPENSRKELLAQRRSVVLRREGMRLSPKIIAEPAPVGEKLTFKSPTKVEPKGDLVQLEKDSVGELNRQKELEVLKKFLAERGVQVDLPPEK